MHLLSRLRHPAYLLAIVLLVVLGVGHGVGVLGREVRITGLIVAVLLLVTGEAASQRSTRR